jgi:hypothetical protein
LVNISFRHDHVEVGTLNKSEEKFVNNLKVWPSKFEDGFVFLRVKGITGRINGRGDGTEKIGGKLDYDESLA